MVDYDRYVMSEVFPPAIMDQDTGDDYPIQDEGIFETVCGLLNDKEKELNQVKHIIVAAYNSERTYIGRSVLKQLLEQIGVEVG